MTAGRVFGWKTADLAHFPALSGWDDWVLTLLYLGSVRLAPSPAPARVSDGVVRDV